MNENAIEFIRHELCKCNDYDGKHENENMHMGHSVVLSQQTAKRMWGEKRLDGNF